MSNEIEERVTAALGSTEDYGAQRLKSAHDRRAMAEVVIRRVVAMHAVSVDAVTKDHVANRKAHVVMARAHAAYALRRDSFSYPQIATALGLSHHSQAMRGDELWRDHLAGRSETVDEPTGRRALAIMRRYDLSIRQAAERLGVSHLKLKGRISTIRAKDKAGARNV